MANRLMGEALASLEGRTLTLAFDNPAWMTVEDLLGGGDYLEIVSAMLKREAEGKSPLPFTMRALLFAATRTYHPELSLEDCVALLAAEPAPLYAALGEAMRASIPFAKAPAPGEAPPAATPAKKTRKGKPGTGKQS